MYGEELHPRVEDAASRAETAFRHWFTSGGAANVEARASECEEAGGNADVLPEAILAIGLQYLHEVGLIEFTDPPEGHLRPVLRW